MPPFQFCPILPINKYHLFGNINSGLPLDTTIGSQELQCFSGALNAGLSIFFGPPPCSRGGLPNPGLFITSVQTALNVYGGTGVSVPETGNYTPETAKALGVVQQTVLYFARQGVLAGVLVSQGYQPPTKAFIDQLAVEQKGGWAGCATFNALKILSPTFPGCSGTYMVVATPRVTGTYDQNGRACGAPGQPTGGGPAPPKGFVQRVFEGLNALGNSGPYLLVGAAVVAGLGIYYLTLPARASIASSRAELAVAKARLAET